MADDNISRQVVIDALHGYFDGMLETDTWSPCDVYGLIETLPSAQTVTPCHLGSPCEYQNPDAKMASAELPDICVGDIISRRAAIDVLDTGLWGVEWDKALATAMLKDLPPAERKGHWKTAYALTEYRYRCSECFANHRARYDYCPSCGARMERE